jgi:hypothetical protein
MSFYHVPGDPEVLYKADGFEVCKYEKISKHLLMHKCALRTLDNKANRVIEGANGGWFCTCCGEEPPVDVITVHIMMDGSRAKTAKYYHTVTFSELTEIVDE